MFSKCRI